MFNHVSENQTTDAFGNEPGSIHYRTMRGRNTDPELRAPVTLFRASGKYYTSEMWRIPAGAIGPGDMKRSPDFRRIEDGGAVLVSSELSVGNGEENGYTWGFPHLFP